MVHVDLDAGTVKPKCSKSHNHISSSQKFSVVIMSKLALGILNVYVHKSVPCKLRTCYFQNHSRWFGKPFKGFITIARYS